MRNLSFNESERDLIETEQLSKSMPIKVRCPKCYKLYSVEPMDLAQPPTEFQCRQCSTCFWLGPVTEFHASEIIGFPMDWLVRGAQDPSVETGSAVTAEPQILAEEEAHRLCPLCAEPNSASAAECRSCLVVFDKLSDSETRQLGSLNLSRTWQSLLQDFGNLKLHAEFLAQCQKNLSLPYAAAMYGRILDACPTHEVALEQQARIRSLVGANFDQKATRRRRFRFYYVTLLVLFLAGMLTAIGIVLPEYRNLVGLGAAVIFLVWALR